MSRLLLLGLNHKTAPVAVRERLALPASRLGHALGYVRDVPGIEEAVILSTCNRVEIYAWGDERAQATLRHSLVDYHSFESPGALLSHLYEKSGAEAAQHLFEVVSGLDSLVLGEAEILGQVKAARERALEANTSGVALDELFRRAVTCGKRARTETTISRGALSVGAAGVELAKQIFGSLSGHTVLILGAGKMSARVAQCLVSSGAHRVLVSNRTFERAQELAETFNGGAGAEAITWDDFPSRFAEADIVISSTRAPHYVVTPQHIEATAKLRRRSLLLVDIAVPRDVDPECNRFDDVFLFDVDDLQGVVEKNRRERLSEVAPVKEIVAQEVEAWTKWTQTLDTRPTVAALAKRADAVREREVALTLQKTLGQLSHLDERDRATVERAVETLARSLSQKLMHPAIAHLKNGGAGDAAAIKRAFDLEDQSQRRNDDVVDRS